MAKQVTVTVIEHHVLDIGTWVEIHCPNDQVNRAIKTALSTQGHKPSTEYKFILSYTWTDARRIAELLTPLGITVQEEERICA